MCKELTIIGPGPEDWDRLIPSFRPDHLVPPPGHIDIEDRRESFITLCETLSKNHDLVVQWVEAKVVQA